ncbi:MAG: HAMP domain-containing sensor histidine kinase [Nitriliruptor sp.]
MSGRISGLIAVELLLVGGGLWVIERAPLLAQTPGEATVVVFAAAMIALAFLPPIYLEHRRHRVWVTPTDGAFLVGLFMLGPLATVAVATAAEILIAARHREPPMKFVFNLTSMLGGYTAAAAVFAVIGRTDPLDPLAWAAGAVALAVCAIWDLVSTAGLFSVIEAKPFRSVVNRVGPAQLASLVLSVGLGLLAVVLVSEHALAIVLVAPVLAALVASTRSLGQTQAERSRLQRLFDASSNLAPLTGRQETLAGIAEECRGLITGVAGICITSRGSEPWHGVAVDDHGARGLGAPTIARLLAAADHSSQGVREFPEGSALTAELPALPAMVWATGRADGDVRVLVAVLLEFEGDDQDDHRADVLATFAAHAASVVTNVELHEDVQQALTHQLQLNRQKSEFVAAVSHELRTPLASLIGTIQTLQRSGHRLTEEQRENLLSLGAAGGARLRGLIEDLLLVAAAEHQAVRVEQDSIDPVELIDGILAELTPEARDRVEVRIGPVGGFLSDEDKVRRILLNIIENARKYAPEGPIEVAVARRDGKLRFTVDDHGPGIALADRERIFERFLQLDGSSTRRQGGTGLGLHLSRELAGMLSGTLTVGEATGGGARFTLELPQRRSHDAIVAVTAPVAAGVEVQLPISPGRSMKASPLRHPVGVAAGAGAGDGGGVRS